MIDRLTAHDLGVAASPLRPEPPKSYSLGVVRPHPSPAMEAALKRIEEETPKTLRRVLAGGRNG